jgi:hypothetical protein
MLCRAFLLAVARVVAASFVGIPLNLTVAAQLACGFVLAQGVSTAIAFYCFG